MSNVFCVTQSSESKKKSNLNPFLESTTPFLSTFQIGIEECRSRDGHQICNLDHIFFPGEICKRMITAEKKGRKEEEEGKKQKE
jgi:hypothetical protein